MVGIVRRPDPVPCPNCAVGEWDMCRTACIRSAASRIDGFMSERWRMTVRHQDRPLTRSLGVLLEPRPWSRRRGSRSSPSASAASGANVLVTGAGPIGLLPPSSGGFKGSTSTCWTAPVGTQAGSRSGLGATTTPVTSRRGVRAGRIIDAPGSGRSSTTRSRGCGGRCGVSTGVGAGIHGGPPRLTSRQRQCSRTTSSSAASTPTSVTGTERDRHWPTPIARGWRAYYAARAAGGVHAGPPSGVG